MKFKFPRFSSNTGAENKLKRKDQQEKKNKETVKRWQRVCALFMAIAILLTTCFADLPDGSLSFLGNIGEQIVSLFETESAEATTLPDSTRVSLDSQYSTFGISEINRDSSEGLYFFSISTGRTVFCENSGAALHSRDTYKKVTEVTASSYTNQSAARAMVWYFGTVAQGSFTSGGSTLSSFRVHVAIQAYVWAANKSGKNIETTMKQALYNTGLSSSSAASWASAIKTAVDKTSVYGTIVEYECSSCPRGRSLDAHQTMLTWYYNEVEPTKASVSDSGEKTVTEWIKVEINKVEGNTGKKNKIDTATFKVTVDGKSLSSVGTLSVETGSYDSSSKTFSTSGGKVVFYLKRTTTVKVASTGKYWYVSDPGTYSGSKLKEWMAKNGVDYEDKASATAQMNKDLKEALETKATNWLKAEHTWKVTETEAPEGFSLPETKSKSFSETSIYVYTSKDAAKAKSVSFTFTDYQHYAKVKVDKDRDTSVDVDTGSVATLKGATYTIYAAEDIVSYKSGKKVEYKKGAEVTSFKTTTESGVGYSSCVLPAGYKYYIQETEAPTGYQLNKTKTYFKVYYDSTNGYRYKIRTTTKKSDGTYKWTDYYTGQTVDLSKTPNTSAFKDKPTYLQIRVCKVMEDFEIKKISGSDFYYFKEIFSKESAKFTITDTATGEVVDTLTIKANTTKVLTKDGVEYGYDTSIKLPVGKYKVEQISGPTMTSFVSSWTYDASTLTKTKTIKTYYKKNSMKQWGHVKIYKRKNVGGTKSAETDAEFTLYVKDGDNWRALGTLTYIDSTTKSGYGYYAYVETDSNGKPKTDSDGNYVYIDLPVGHGSTRYTYKVVQTGGDTSVSWMEDQTFKFDYTKNPTKKKTVTKSFTVTDGAAMIEIHKDKSEADEDGETQSSAEAGAVFYVFKSTSSSSYKVHDYSKNTTSGKITISSSTITLDALMKKLADSDREAYLKALKTAYPSLFVEDSVLTTDSDGDAEGELGGIDGDTYFIVMQATGDDGYALADPYTFIAEDGSKKIYYYDAKDPKYQTEVSIYKTTREIDGETSSEVINPEAEAVFAVLRVDQMDGTASSILSELKAENADERLEDVYKLIASAAGISSWETLRDDMTYAQVAALVETLSKTDAVASLIVTDEEGNGYDVIDCTDESEEFVVVQIVGETGYDLANPESFEYVFVDGLASSENEDGDATESFSFEWTDPAYQKTVEITKTMTDSLGENEEPEEGAQFYILKSTVLEDGTLKASAEALAETQAEKNEATWTAGELIDTLSYLESDARLAWAEEAAAAEYSLGIIETDADGKGKLTWMNEDWSGDFVILQTGGKENYSILDAVLSTDTSKVTVDTSNEYNTVYSFSGVDRGPGAYLYIKKEYQSGNNEWKPEEGATFDVLNEAGNKVAEITTDSDGIGYAVLTGTTTPAKLPVDNIYTIVNTGTGPTAKNIKLAGDGEITIQPKDACDKDYTTVAELKAAEVGVTLEYTVKNPANDYQVIFTKISADTGEPVNGAAYEVTAAEVIYDEDGDILYAEGAVIDTMVTGQNDDGLQGDDSTENLEGTEIPEEDPVEETITATSEVKESESQEEQTEGETIETTEDGEEESEEDDGDVGDVDGEDDGTADTGSDSETASVTGDGTAYTYLPYGTYYLKETYSPEGFVTSTETIKFRIDESGITYIYTDENGNETESATTAPKKDSGTDTYYVEITAEDDIVTGPISLEKVGDFLAEYDEETGSFSYTAGALANATFAIYAASDITDDAGNIVKFLDKDGNIREMTAVEQGDTDATAIAYVTTDSEGKATFTWTKVIQYGDDKGTTVETDQFYLGNYWVVEVNAPYGNIVDTEWHQATISTSVLEYDEDTVDAEATGTDHGNAGPYASTGPYILTTGETLNEILLGDDYSGATSIVFSTDYTLASSSSLTKVDVSADSDKTVWLVLSEDGETAYIVANVADQVVYLNAVSSHMFENCSQLTSIEFSNVDTSLLVDMSYMFKNCSGLTFLDLSDWDTTSVNYVQQAFYGCTLTSTVYVTDTDWEVNESYYSPSLYQITATAKKTYQCEYEDASGWDVSADEITLEDFVICAWYQQTYTASAYQMEITLTEDDIASITPDTASEEYASDEWKAGTEDTFTMTVTITLSEDSEWYCTDGSWNNEITAEITVRCPDRIDTGADKTEHPTVTISVDDPPATMDIQMRKIEEGDDEDDNTVTGATFTLYANVDIYNADGTLLAKAGDMLAQKISDSDTDWAEFYDLPIDLYADESTYLAVGEDTYNIGYTVDSSGEQTETKGITSGNYMYKVIETPPSGYGKCTVDGKEVAWYFSGDAGDVTFTTNDITTVTYDAYAENTKLEYITVEKIWDDALDAKGERPEFVMVKAVSGNDEGNGTYYIVLTEETAYLIQMSSLNASQQAQVNYYFAATNGTIATLDKLVAYASYSKATTVLTDKGTVEAGTETETWRVVLDNEGWTKLNGTTDDFDSPFTKGSTWTFTEGIELIEAMMAKLATGDSYSEDLGRGNGSYNTETSTWQAKNVITIDYTSASVQKVWTDDDSEYRPTSLTVQLYRRVEGSTKWVAVSGQQATLDEDNGWYYKTRSDLDATNSSNETYEYMWQETAAYDSSGTYRYTFTTDDSSGVKYMEVYDAATDAYLARYTVSEEYEYDAASGVWVTSAENSLLVKNASVRKVWEDADGNAITDIPDTTYVTLWATTTPDDESSWYQVDLSGAKAARYTSSTTLKGTETDTAVKLGSSNDWAYTVENLPKYDTSGTEKKEIYYRFREAQAGDTVLAGGKLITLADDWLTDYEVSYSGGSATELTTVTNTLMNKGHITASKKILASDLEKLAAFDMVPAFTFTLSWTETDDSGTETDQSDSVTFVFATEADYADKVQSGVSYVYLADDAEADAEGYLTISSTWEELAYNTYTVTESGEDVWYELSDILAYLASSTDLDAKSATFVINSATADYDFEAVFENTLRTGSLTIHKTDAKGNALADVGFTLYKKDGTSYKTGTTDSDGNLTFTGIAIGSYELRETSGTDGNTLLADPIEVTMPLVLTDAQIALYALQGITVDKTDAIGEDGSWYFYSLSYTVTNTSTFDMPFTGSTGRTILFVALAAGLLLLVSAASLAQGRKKGRRHHKKARKTQVRA